MYALVAIALAALGLPALLWLVDRHTQSPAMRQRVNAGTDRYLAERARARAAAFGGSTTDTGALDGPGFELGDGGCDAGDGGGSCD